MGSHDNIYVTALQSLIYCPLFGSRSLACQGANLYTKSRKELFQCFKVLQSEYFSGRHHCALISVFGTVVHKRGSHHGFA